MNIKQYLDFESLKKAIKNNETKQILDKNKVKDIDEYVDLLEIWYDGKNREIVSVDVFFNSYKIAQSFLEKNSVLSNEIQKDFDETYDGEGFIDWMINWIIERGWEVGELGSDNTYNWEDWFGSVFEYVHFVDDNREGLIIMWHLGGDVRGRYSTPEIWFGDIYDFFGIPSGDLNDIISGLLGYSDIYELDEDIEKVVLETVEREKDIIE